jgi:hypothetical protein
MLKKLLPLIFLFTGFQANAILVGNLIYDGTYISGDGRTYVGLNTIASWDYATTLAATQVNGQYEGFRIANTADADVFIGSLFGDYFDNCSTVDGTASITSCGRVTGWADGRFGDNTTALYDQFFFIADENIAYELGITSITSTGDTRQLEGWFHDINYSNRFADGGVESDQPISWLLVMDTVVQANEPSILALMVLGIFGTGFARRRR